MHHTNEQWMSSRAILMKKKKINKVDKLNDKIMEKPPGSIDSVAEGNQFFSLSSINFEFTIIWSHLHTVKISDVITKKKKTTDHNQRHCNGTHYMVLTLYWLWEQLNSVDTGAVPTFSWIPLQPSDTDLSSILQDCKFLMSINKSEGQSLERCGGLYLSDSVFIHGHFYVANRSGRSWKTNAYMQNIIQQHNQEEKKIFYKECCLSWNIAEVF